MVRLDFTRCQAEYIEALDWQFEQPHTPDGLDFWDVLHLQALVDADLQRRKTHAPTSWLTLDEQEKAAIRSRRWLHVVPPTTNAIGSTHTGTAA